MIGLDFGDDTWEYFIGGVPIKEWERRKKLSTRRLTPEELGDTSKRISEHLFVAEDPENDFDWIVHKFNDESIGDEVGTLKDGKISWYIG